MKSAELLLVGCTVALASFIAREAISAYKGFDSGFRLEETAAGAIEVTRPDIAPENALTHGKELLVAAIPWDDPMSSGPRTMSREEIRRRLLVGDDATYLGDLLLARDSALTRWPDRTTRPVRVFIRDNSSLPQWTSEYLPAVRDAFVSWTQAGLPLRFDFVADSSTADVHIHFTDQIASGISGRTVWSRDDNYWLIAGNILLAVSHPSGEIVTPPQMRAIALHEVGHLIGLDHSLAPDNIMSARIGLRDLTEADRATARMVYSLPAGSIR